MAFTHIRDDVSNKEASKQSSKETDFTIILIWWGSLRLATTNTIYHPTYSTQLLVTITA